MWGFESLLGHKNVIRWGVFMIKHIVSFRFIDILTAEEKSTIAKDFKKRVEALKDIVEGIHHIEVLTSDSLLDTGNVDIVIDSLYESEKALADYQVHPAHYDLVNDFGTKCFKDRTCIDYEIKPHNS